MPALRPRASLTAVLAIAVSILAVTVTPSVAAGVPWSDPNAQGFVAFCDASGNNVTGGDINATPFVWKAISSYVPKSAYQGVGENAALEIYQPRPDVLPADWSGGVLTAASFYKNPALPAVEATDQDYSLASFIHQFPAKLDGLYQVRMTFGKQNYGLISAPYPATTIRVTGSTWQVVSGGQLPCRSAVTVSQEILTGIAQSGLRDGTETVRTGGTPIHAAPVNPSAAESPSAPRPSTSGTSRSASTGRVSPSAPGTGSAAPATALASAGRTDGTGTSPAIWIAICAVLALVGGAGVWARRGRSAQAPAGSDLHGK